MHTYQETGVLAAMTVRVNIYDIQNPTLGRTRRVSIMSTYVVGLCERLSVSKSMTLTKLWFNTMQVSTCCSVSNQTCHCEPQKLCIEVMCRFRVLNQRQDLIFKLFSNISQSGNFSDADVIATGKLVRIDNANEPTQGHLAMTSTIG